MSMLPTHPVYTKTCNHDDQPCTAQCCSAWPFFLPQGMVGKLLGWLDPGGAASDTPPGVRRHVARLPSGGAPDFTAVTEDPDRRRHRQQQPSRQQPQREAAVHINACWPCAEAPLCHDDESCLRI